MNEIAEIIGVIRDELRDPSTALELAHDLGHALPEMDDEGLLAIRNALANLSPNSDVARASAAILVEVVDGFRLGRKRHDSIVIRKGLSRDVLECIERGCSTTSEIAKHLGCDDSQVSRVLDRLRAVDLVEPPQREPIDRRRATHQLTLRAKTMLRRLDRAERNSDVWRLSIAAPARVEVVVDEHPTERPDDDEVVVPKQAVRSRAVPEHPTSSEPSLKGATFVQRDARTARHKPIIE